MESLRRDTVTRSAIIAVPSLALLVLALYAVGVEPLSRDEVWSVEISGRPLLDALEVVANREPNMALYYVLLHGWMQLGDGEGYVRLLSALAATGGVAATAALAYRLFGRTAAIVAGTLIATNVFMVGYAQEARSYAFVTLLAPLSFHALVRLVERRTARDTAVYVAVTAALLYMQILAGLLVIAQLASLVLLRDLPWRRLAAAMAGLALATLPLLASVAFGELTPIAQLPRPDLALLLDVLSALLGAPLLAAVVALCGIQALAGLIGDLRRTGRSTDTWARGLILAWVIIPPGALFVVSQEQPMFYHRYLIGILPGVVVLAGMVVARLERRRPRVLVAGALLTLALLVLAVSEHPRPTPEDLPAASTLVAQNARPGDAIAFDSRYARVGFGHYLDETRVRARVPLPDVSLGTPAERRGDIVASEAPPADVLRRIGRADRVWLVSYPDVTRDRSREPVTAVGMDLLRRDFVRAGVRRYGEVQVSLYRAAASAR